MATEIVNSIKRLDKRSFSDYNYLVTEINRSITDLAKQNTDAFRSNKSMDDYTFRSNTIDYVKNEYNKKLREFVNVFLWAGNEELIRNELSVNPNILKEISQQSYKYLEPLIEQSMSSGLNGPSGMHTAKVWQDHFNRNYNSGYYLKPKISKPKEKNEGCFVATFAYESYEHKNVVVLRNYRDEVMNDSVLGKSFINLYYKYSPGLVRFLDFIKFPKVVIKFILEIVISVISIKK